MHIRGALAMVFGGALAAAGCSTHYMPARGPHLRTIVEGGQLVYVHDGQEFSHGFAGGGLVDAVASDPQAKEAAETYEDHNVAGFVLDLGGTVVMIGGALAFGIAESDYQAGRSRDTSAEAIGGTAFVAGLAAAITGIALIASAQPYQYDAINIYNDHVDERLRASPLRYEPPPGYPLPPRYSLPPGYVPRPAPSGAPAPAPSAAPAPAAAPSAAPRGSSAPLPPPPPAPTGVEE
jgi:hypothetical protein